jgi:molybdate transport system permease protein
MLTEADLVALWTTLRLATIATLILLAIGTPLAWWLARTSSKLRAPIEAIIALPIVLPPTVLGFYLLIALGPDGPIGGLMTALGGQPLAFTFTGLVIGSVVYSLPFVVQPLQNAFMAIGERSLEVAATLRASPADRFFSIAVPLARPGFITAIVLGFAHTVGEFGVVLMIGGNIPGETQVLSIAIYDHVEAMNYAGAHLLAGGLLAASFFMLLAVYAFNRRVALVRL